MTAEPASQQSAPSAQPARRRAPGTAASPAAQAAGRLAQLTPSLSPSRAADFKTCPLLYRFRSIDRLPERPRPTRPGARWCTRCWSGSSTCPPASAPRRPPARWSRPQWQRLRRRAAGAGRALRRRGAARAGAEFLDRPPRCWTATSPWRIPRRLEPAERESLVAAGRRRRTADPRLHRPARRGARRRPAGGRLQDRRRAPRGVRGAGAVPAEVLRAGAVAHPRGGPPGAAPALPQGRRGPATTPPMPRNWCGSSARWWRCGGRSSRPPRGSDFRPTAEPAV